MSELRFNKLVDVTRWNRAGLKQFQYIDGDAATWLEELRLAAMGLYARGAEFEDRLPENWRNRFADEKDPGFDETAFQQALVWQSLYQAFPDKPETARGKNRRLLKQYEQFHDDYGWEIMRAASRGAHILLGHLNAYTNEGYIRTATQWQNVARLAAMVNYQPAPASSATTSVGLFVHPTDDNQSMEVDRGLAMKFSPPEGGPPVVFETLDAIKVHADLNDCRARLWDMDPTPLTTTDLWQTDGDVSLNPGGFAVLDWFDGEGSIVAVTLNAVTATEHANTVSIQTSALAGAWTRGLVQMHVNASDIRKALPRSIPGKLVLKINTASSYQINSPVRLHYNNSAKELLVLDNRENHLTLSDTDNVLSSVAHGDVVSVETLVPVTNTGVGTLAPATLGTKAFFMNTNGTLANANGDIKYVKDEDDNLTDLIEGIDFSGVLNVVGSLFVVSAGAKRESATVVAEPDSVLTGSGTRTKIVSFAGKQPKKLSVGARFLMRDTKTNALIGLRVAGITQRDDEYSIQFEQNVTNNYNSFQPNQVEFHGPLLDQLRPKFYNRNPGNAFAGNDFVVGQLSDAARELLRLGKPCLVENELTGTAVLVNLVEAVNVSSGLKLVFEPSDQLTGYQKGWTKLNFNTVKVSHGETNSPKTLGSGDAEKPAQSFHFKANDVSFVPSNLAEVGVAPDMEIAVDGVVWSYRDLIDPSAADTDSYSMSLNEDSSLQIHFRRRLPTGTNNVVVTHYRTGVGLKGMVPARAFTKPMKKHRYVYAISQPFAASGGAEREAVADIRDNAPARLAANGRAVSLQDFERLSVRRSDIWQAKAKAITDPRNSHDIRLTVVPSGGGLLGASLKTDLAEFLRSRSTPGIRVELADYQPIRLMAETTIRVDTEKYDRTQVQANAHATLISTFNLQNRRLGQPVYISEIAAALERVDGVSTATVQSFQVSDDSVLLKTARTNGSASAYFPFDHQLISAQSTTAVTDFVVVVEALT